MWRTHAHVSVDPSLRDAPSWLGRCVAPRLRPMSGSRPRRIRSQRGAIPRRSRRQGGVMNSEVRRKLDMVDRVRGFISARTAIEPAFGPALARLEELLGRAGAILARQHDGRAAARTARTHRVELRRKLQLELARYLVTVGAFAAKGQTELAGIFKLPSPNATNAAFLVAVKSLLIAGQLKHDLLVQAGMTPTLLDDLAKMVADFQAASAAARDARRDHVEARIELDAITTELTEQVNLLDGITRYRFGFDSVVMSEWKEARALLGLRHNGVAVAQPTDPTPTPAGEVKNAA